MPFGEIFTGAFQRIWRHKKLWLLAMLGLALTGLGMLLYTIFMTGWLGDYFSFMNEIMRYGDTPPGRVFGDFMASMSWMWGGLAIFGLLSLIGYVVNLIARGAIIAEAARAWRGEATDASRGLRFGASRAPYVLLIDILWWLPAILLLTAAMVLFFVLLVGSAAASEGRGGGALVGIGWLASLCGGGCLVLLYYLAYAVFSPLMYQSAVTGQRPLGEAIREGWTLARKNLGAMVIFWLLLLIVGIVLNSVLQAGSTLASLPLMGSWFRAMGEMMEGIGPGGAPEIPTLSVPLLGLLSVLSAVVWFLIATFTQTLNLTVYAGVYQHLNGGIAPVTAPAAPPVAPPPSEPLPPAPIVPENPEVVTPVITATPDPERRSDEPPLV